MPMSKLWDSSLLKKHRQQAWTRHGKKIHFYVPGMFVRDGEQGEYPALSVTGKQCKQHCAHCNGILLHNMPDVSTPERLIKKCRQLSTQGMQGVLLSGGCNGHGEIPWHDFIPAIAAIKKETSLFISVHGGMLNLSVAEGLKQAGIDQVLIDVIGSAATYAHVYRLPHGLTQLEQTLDALNTVGLPVVPHIVAGLHFGVVRGERKALQCIARRPPAVLVIVVCMSLAHTDFTKVVPPSPKEVCNLILYAQELMPDTVISLGCARPRHSAVSIEKLALLAGVNRMALPAHETVTLATQLGLEIHYHKTCCSVSASVE